MLQMLRDLTPLDRAICSRGYDRAVEYLCEELPFRVISIPSTFRHNGWVIPPSWDVEEARIVKDGHTVYDGTAHPLGVIALSSSFSGSPTFTMITAIRIPFHSTIDSNLGVGVGIGDFVSQSDSSIN
jgi:aminopeptidase-like protein